MVVRYPPMVPAGRVCDTPAMTIDLLPTIAEIAGAELPAREIDGTSIVPQWRGDEAAPDPHEALYFWYAGDELQAMRSGRWKLHFPHTYRSLDGREPGNNGRPAKYRYGVPIGLELFDLTADPAETTDVAEANPEVVARLSAMADEMRGRLGDKLTKTTGSEIRNPRQVPKEDA